MKIMIDIDENVFTRLFDNGMEDYTIWDKDLFAMAKAIRNGTPLPEHHGKLIDVDALYENTEICHSDIDGYACVRWKDINDAPTIIEGE